MKVCGTRVQRVGRESFADGMLGPTVVGREAPYAE